MLKRFGASQGSRPSTAPAAIHARASRQRQLCVKPLAFKPTAHELLTTALQFPTPFHATHGAADSPSAVLSPKLNFHSSVWYHELFGDSDASPQEGLLHGADTYHTALNAFHSSYASAEKQTLKLWSAADENTSNAFFMFVSKIRNTGAYAGCKATQSASTVHGIFRVHMDEEGQVDDVWCFRAPTSEEKRSLLKPPHSSDASWPAVLSLHTYVWQDDKVATAHIKSASLAWVHDVLAKSDISVLGQLAHTDLTYYEGHTLHSGDPMTSAEALQGDLIVRKHAWDTGAVEVLALATHENRAFVHWKLPMMCRKTQLACVNEGTSMLVFDAHGKIVQAVEYQRPNHQERSRLFKRSFCPPQAQKAVGAAGGLSAEALAALARQEQEWVSW